MKNTLAILVLISVFTASLDAQQANRRRRAPRPPMDKYYKLGPDSQSMEGVPKGEYSEAKVIQSEVFPGYQHTYWVYVPAQYDPEVPTAVMVFNDGQALKAEPGDVQAHHVLDNLICRREIPVMLGVFINPRDGPINPNRRRAIGATERPSAPMNTIHPTTNTPASSWMN